MANASELKFPASRAVAQLTVKVKITGLQTLAWRVKVGLFLFKLAARVIGCNVEIEGPHQ